MQKKVRVKYSKSSQNRKGHKEIIHCWSLGKRTKSQL